jgi:hypothetical protein
MKHGIPGLILISLLLAMPAASAQELTEIACGKSLAKDGAAPQLVVDDTLHVMEQTRAGARFDPGAPPPGTTIKSIFCARSDIVPAPSDYKVVAAGYPFMIFARDKDDRSGRTRIAILELRDGQLTMRSVGQSGFTPDMIQRIRTFLDASLPEMGKTAPPR